MAAVIQTLAVQAVETSLPAAATATAAVIQTLAVQAVETARAPRQRHNARVIQTLAVQAVETAADQLVPSYFPGHSDPS